MDHAAISDDGTRDRLKAAAMQLFSVYGIDGVSVRSIVKQAGARNSASIHYYFRTKDELIRELVIDAARHSDEARSHALDVLIKSGTQISVASIVRIIVHAEVAEFKVLDQDRTIPVGFNHMRFVAAMQLNHRTVFLEAIGNRWNRSYLRCIRHLKVLCPNVPRTILNQRLAFMYIFLTSSLAEREVAFNIDLTGGRLWGHSDAVENLIYAISSTLEI